MPHLTGTCMAPNQVRKKVCKPADKTKECGCSLCLGPHDGESSVRGVEKKVGNLCHVPLQLHHVWVFRHDVLGTEQL